MLHEGEFFLKISHEQNSLSPLIRSWGGIRYGPTPGIGNGLGSLGRKTQG